MLSNRSSITLRILLPILLAPLLMLGTVSVSAAEKCSTWEKKLKREQYIILEREAELSLKTKKNQAKFNNQKELERLIERHHASIETFNMKLDDFNRTCRKSRASKVKTKPVIRSVKAQMPDKAQQKMASGTTPPEEMAASKALIKTLKGYYIQVAALKRRAIAEANRSQLNEKGFETVIITRPYIYALWVGPYEDRKEAKAAKETLLNDFKMDGYLIRFD